MCLGVSLCCADFLTPLSRVSSAPPSGIKFCIPIRKILQASFHMAGVARSEAIAIIG